MARPRHARPPFDFSSRQQLRHDTSYTPDTLTYAGEDARRRHRRRLSAAVLSTPIKLQSASLHGFHRRQACQDRTDVANTAASSPSSLRPCSDVAMDDLIH